MSDSQPNKNSAEPRSSKLGQFIQAYSAFLSSFVIGVAGLVATSIWQYRQSEIAQAQAASDQAITKAKADNEWRIARADILAKNLDVLSAQGQNTADRRFGVLLSLTRADILDPELAVSYALELGKDNATYMRLVLANTHSKSYVQLAQAFELTCVERYGVEKDADICKGDKLSDRSEAIAALVEDELEAGFGKGDTKHGPMALLANEDEVQALTSKLAWLFEPYLQDLYEHRRWRDIERFETFSTGSRLVSALVLSTARTGELVSDAQAKQTDEFHSKHRQWLSTYFRGPSCSGECRARLVDFMLSTVMESDGDYDAMLKELLLKSRAEVMRAVNQIHTRLLWCQIDSRDQNLLRDAVVVPAIMELLTNSKHPSLREPAILDDLVGIIALVPPPSVAAVLTAAPLEGLAPPSVPAIDQAATAQADAAVAAWEKMRSLVKQDAKLDRTLSNRQQRAQRQRIKPPGMVKKYNFCNLGPAGGQDHGSAVP